MCSEENWFFFHHVSQWPKFFVSILFYDCWFLLLGALNYWWPNEYLQKWPNICFLNCPLPETAFFFLRYAEVQHTKWLPLWYSIPMDIQSFVPLGLHDFSRIFKNKRSIWGLKKELNAARSFFLLWLCLYYSVFITLKKVISYLPFKYWRNWVASLFLI